MKSFTMMGSALLLSACTSVPVVSMVPLTPAVIPAPPVMPTAYTEPGIAVYQPPIAAAPVTATPIATHPVNQANPVVNQTNPVVLPPTLSATASPPLLAPTINADPSGLQNLSGIAERIFKNETGGDDRRLINWNAQENFVELGIGHMVWYPANKRGRFAETFPAYMKFTEANRIPLPAWLAKRPTDGGPWADKSAFDRAQNDPQMAELRNFLRKTLNLQANFMAQRLRQNLPAMVQPLPPGERQLVLNNFRIMEQSPGGLYPVLDYLQFQGDGANPNDRYRGQGWGLVQTLQAMEPVAAGPAALSEFMRASNDVLLRRIANSPAERREARFLAAWEGRLRTYSPNSSTASR